MKENENKKLLKRKERGITLIALVITIIVLLILAAVSIAMLTGQNGILTQAQNAKKDTETASLIEQAKTDVLGIQAGNGGKISKDEFVNVLKKYFDGVPEAEDLPDDLTTLTLTTKTEYGSYPIKISDIYNGTLEGTTTTGGEVTEVSAANYGDKVNYVSKKEETEGTNLTWRIFYDDENYVYLISSKEDGSNTVDACTLEDYISNYEVGSDAVPQELRFLNSQWYGVLGSTPSTNDNAKAVAYLMDQSVWDEYKDNTGHASYAIGGPTLELFMNSYNNSEDTTNEIKITNCTSTGYSENTAPNWLSVDYNNGIYNNGSSSSWWLASPYNDRYAVGVFYVNGYPGILNYTTVSVPIELRPIVLIPKSEFQYQIVPET